MTSGSTQISVLFFEDNPDICDWLRTVLPGCETAVESDFSEECLAKLLKADLVVSDFHMPKGLFEKVRLACEKHKKPLLIITGDSSVRSKHVLYKPFRKEELSDAVFACLAGA